MEEGRERERERERDGEKVKGRERANLAWDSERKK